MAKKNETRQSGSVLGASGLNGKSVTGVQCYFLGSMGVVEISFSGGSCLIKELQGQFEVGGTDDWGTGTKQNI